MLDVKTIKELLHKRELKATNSRIDLLSNLDKFGSAMPYSAIQKALKSTDRVTLYRTLQTLSDKGIIHKAAHIDNEDYYEGRILETSSKNKNWQIGDKKIVLEELGSPYKGNFDVKWYHPAKRNKKNEIIKGDYNQYLL